MKGKKITSLLVIAVLLLTTLAIAIPLANADQYDLELGSNPAEVANAVATTDEQFLGDGSWSVVNEENKMELYLYGPSAWGTQPLDMLGSFTIAEIESISWATKKPTDGNDVDFYLGIYTEKYTGDSGKWYGQCLTFEGIYAPDRVGALADQWNVWTTADDGITLTVSDHNNAPIGFYTAPTFDDIQAGPIIWDDYHSGAETEPIDYTIQTVMAIAISTGSGWCGDFVGYLDSIEVVLTEGRSATIDLETGEATEMTLTGDGFFTVPDADTVVTYDDAVDCIITVEDLVEDDVAEGTFSGVGDYVDVKIENPDAVDSIHIEISYDEGDVTAAGLVESELILYWYDGADWSPCSHTGVNTDANYIWADITDETVPSLSQLTGTEFGPGGGLALDSEFYKNVDEITVDVGSTFANDDPIRINTLEVHAKCDPTDLVGIDVELTETGVDTGVFTGSFPITDVIPPPMGYLAVDEGNTVIVKYTYNDGDDHTFTDTATIDETPPEFVDTFVESDAYFYKDTDTITLTAKLDTADYTVTADFSAIDSEYTAEDEDVTPDGLVYTIEYEISEDNTMADGLYIIPVTAEDAAGNTATYDFSTTLDNTKPSVTDATADPGVIQPDEATPVTFTVSVSDELSLVDSVMIDLSEIDGSATQEMTEITETIEEGTPEEEEVGTGVYEVAEATYTVTSEGDYVLPITATDTIGNENALEAITLKVIADLDAPVFVSADVTYPTGADSARTDDSVLVTVVATDDLSEVDTITIDATEIGVLTTPEMTKDELLDDTWTATLTVGAVDPGTYELTLTATDFATNTATEIVTVEVTTKLTGYYVELVEGWNLMSLPLIPDAPSVTVVLADILADVKSVWAYDAATGWSSYAPGAPSDLTAMVDGKGYWINMDADATLSISGVELPEPPALPPAYYVVEGWNMIGFKDVDPRQCQFYLAGVYDDCARIYGFSDGSYNVLEDTTKMVPGFGYWIAMTEPGSIYP